MNEKLDVGNVLQRVFDTYRDQFSLLIPAALVVFIPVAILNGLILGPGTVEVGLLAAVVGIVATYWFQGMVVEAARDILDGRRDYTVGSLLTSVTPVLGPLIGAGLLAGIATGIGFILLIVPGLFLLTIWAVLAPVIVIERPGVFPAFGRSRDLVRGHGWQVFGVIVVLFLIQLVVAAIARAIVVGLTDTFAGAALADLITRLLVAPLSALAAAILYFELRRLHGESAVGGDVAQAAPAGGPAPPPEAPTPPPSQPGGPPPPRP
jgi:MFS family permease